MAGDYRVCFIRRVPCVSVVLPALTILMLYITYYLCNQDARDHIALKQIESPRTPELIMPDLKRKFERFPSNYSSGYRNPCWEEGNSLRCLPYFYQIGSYKCGSTDVWSKLVQHPSIIPVAKEIHWWAWRRFGYTKLPLHADLVLKIRNVTGMKDDRSLQWYFNFISDQATPVIKKNHNLVFGDGSVSNLWGLAEFAWRKSPEEPTLVYLADLIHTLQPAAKITAVLRDPVEKLWTTYRLGANEKMNFEKYFDAMVRRSTSCLKAFTEKYCAFVHGRHDPTAPYGNPIDQGKYVIYLEEWVRAFGQGNVHVMRLEDWKENAVKVLDELIQHLELEPLPQETLAQIIGKSAQNVNKKSPHNTSMTPIMRKKVQDYYRPWNVRLVTLLNENAYLWGY